MPSVYQILARQPSPLDNAGNFRFGRIVRTIPDQTTGSLSVCGGLVDKRGCYYEVGGQRLPATLMIRQNGVYGSYVAQTFGGDFGYPAYTFLLTLLPNYIVYIHTLATIDDVSWGLGMIDAEGLGYVPVIAANPFGNDPRLGTGFIDRSGDANAIYGFSRAAFIRKARGSGYLYYTLKESAGTNMRIMRGTSPSLAFSTITPSALNMGAQTVEGYDVSYDGQIQVVAGSGGNMWRSVNGGVSFSAVFGSVPVTSVVYSRAWDAWISAGPGGPMYATGDASTWTTSTLNTATDSCTVVFSHIEKIDPDGRYLMAVSGYAPMLTYISEDGGKRWFSAQQLLTPYYDTSAQPVSKVVSLVHTGHQILLYQGSTDDWNGDNGLFVSGYLNL